MDNKKIHMFNHFQIFRHPAVFGLSENHTSKGFVVVAISFLSLSSIRPMDPCHISTTTTTRVTRHTPFDAGNFQGF